MEAPTLKQTLSDARPHIYVWGGLTLVALVYFFGFHKLFVYGNGSYAAWNWDACNPINGMVHGRFVPLLFLAFVYMGWKHMKDAPVKPSLLGLVGIVLFFLLYLAAIRTKQPRLILFGIPFLVAGSTQFLFGWKVTKHMLFPAFFWYFAMPIPMVQQATSLLQIWVTKMCFGTGEMLGMEIAVNGNNIESTRADGWKMDIAEGCSGIRSLMALIMISAIYAYYTQKALWKKALLFASALPLAMLGNYGRIVTMLFLNEAGFEEFSNGAYHNWAGLLIFFPVALAGLFLLDRLLNPTKRKLRKRGKKKVVSSKTTTVA